MSDADATGTIVLRRVRAWVDRARAYRVLLDEEEIARIRHDTTVRLGVPAGKHELRLRLDWVSSPTLTVEVPAGEEVVLICRPGLRDSDIWVPFRGLPLVTWRRHEYIQLFRGGEVPPEPRRHVSTPEERAIRRRAWLGYGAAVAVLVAGIAAAEAGLDGGPLIAPFYVALFVALTVLGAATWRALSCGPLREWTAWLLGAGVAAIAGSVAWDVVDEIVTGGSSTVEGLIMLIGYLLAFAGLVLTSAFRRPRQRS